VLALLEQGIAQIEARGHGLRGQPHRLAKRHLRVGGAAALRENGAEGGVGVRARGIARDRVARQRFRLVVMALLERGGGALETRDQLVHGHTVGSGRGRVKPAAGAA
jgi:hypothetical protein